MPLSAFYQHLSHLVDRTGDQESSTDDKSWKILALGHKEDEHKSCESMCRSVPPESFA